jgi:hypothetical protein
VRYVVALVTGRGYVVWDRSKSRIADGLYLARVDAQWAADQRNEKARIND